MDKALYEKTYTEEDTPGWASIDAALEKIYGEAERRHYGPLCGVHYAIGGTDPIDGASIYVCAQQSPHRHVISYGMSELYHAPGKAGGEFSKWGFEFTIRLAPFAGDENDPIWAVHVMNNLDRYVIKSGKWFEENHVIPAGGPIRLDTDTQITGFVFTIDPELGEIDTPHGKLSFLQLVGITETEFHSLPSSPQASDVKKLIEKLRVDNPLLITDLTRI